MFDLLGLNDSQAWLKDPASTWHSSPAFQKFEEFTLNLSVVNDVAERGVKLISDFIDKCEDEEQIHHLTHCIEWHRNEFGGYTKTILAKM